MCTICENKNKWLIFYTDYFPNFECFISLVTQIVLCDHGELAMFSYDKTKSFLGRYGYCVKLMSGWQ